MDLKPCPFCGGKVVIGYGSEPGDSYSEGLDGWYISCESCPCSVFIYNDTINEKELIKERIINIWNKRYITQYTV